jgi:ABC-type amino acid transport substrate-binding protein
MVHLSHILFRKELNGLKILILSCDTGEGHNSAGKAIKEAAEHKGHSVTMIDMFLLSGKGTSHAVSGAYIGIVKHIPFFFGLLYKVGMQEIAKNYGVQDSLLEQEPCEFKQSDSDSDVDYIKSQGKMIVGITEFEPMDYKDKDDKWIGFDADMARLLGEKLGVDVEFVVIDWDNKVMELDSKKIDVVWNGIVIKALFLCHSLSS